MEPTAQQKSSDPIAFVGSVDLCWAVRAVKMEFIGAVVFIGHISWPVGFVGLLYVFAGFVGSDDICWVCCAVC